METDVQFLLDLSKMALEGKEFACRSLVNRSSADPSSETIIHPLVKDDISKIVSEEEKYYFKTRTAAPFSNDWKEM